MPRLFFSGLQLFHMAVQNQSILSANIGSPAEDPSVLPRDFCPVLFNLEFNPASHCQLSSVDNASWHLNLLKQIDVLSSAVGWLFQPCSTF